ncbi:hypothetical protein HCA89_00265 [Listeria innocua]|uniref:Uncharacterized protein n=1 Tax=Listeria innocua TaxID=1642 RepID=A0AB73H540_LISIO|nr:hypothetical protein [Listeria innocua]MBC2140726.1 hypothetical protein [Listeria innocua]
MIKHIERLNMMIDKMETALVVNRMILADKLDLLSLKAVLAEIEAYKVKIKKLEKMAGITESNADIVQIPNKNTDFVYCNVKTFGFDEGRPYEVIKINKKQGTFTVFDNNGDKETFSLLAIINNNFSVSKKQKNS